MSTVSSTTSSSSSSSLYAALNGTSGSTATTTADEMQTRFLNLLVTQLQNQDPLNPMDNSQMTTQLSQISTVTGIEKLNATLEKLLGSYSSSHTMQAAAMIGKTVLTAGNTLELGDYSVVGGVTLDGAADKVTVTIKDSSGNTVQTLSLGKQSAGTVNFTWDGNSSEGESMANGTYTFSVAATQAGETVKSTALQPGTVNAVTIGTDGGLVLQLGNNKTASYSDVVQIMN